MLRTPTVRLYFCKILFGTLLLLSGQLTQAQNYTITTARAVTNGVCSAVVTYAKDTTTYNCAITSIILLNGLASGSIFPQGVTTNVWRTMDDSGLTGTCAFTVMVACGTNSELVTVRSWRLESDTGVLTTLKNVPNLDLRLAPNPGLLK